jgi:hypothetical protein
MSNLNQEKFYLMIVGVKNNNDYNMISKRLDNFLSNQKDVCIVANGANESNALVERYALEHNYSTKIFPIVKGVFEEMHKYIAQYDKRGCVEFVKDISNTATYIMKLAAKYNNPYRAVVLNEFFDEELDFDTDSIEEYTEISTHISKGKQFKEVPLQVRKAKQEELDRIDKLLAKKHMYDISDNSITDTTDEFNDVEEFYEVVKETVISNDKKKAKALDKRTKEEDYFTSDTSEDFIKEEQDRIARYNKLDDIEYVKEQEELGKGYAGNVVTYYNEYTNLPSEEFLSLTGQMTRKDRNIFVKQYIDNIYKNKEAFKDFFKFLVSKKNITNNYFDIIIEYIKLQEKHFDEYNTYYLYA